MTRILVIHEIQKTPLFSAVWGLSLCWTSGTRAFQGEKYKILNDWHHCYNTWVFFGGLAATVFGSLSLHNPGVLERSQAVLNAATLWKEKISGSQEFLKWHAQAPEIKSDEWSLFSHRDYSIIWFHISVVPRENICLLYSNSRTATNLLGRDEFHETNFQERTIDPGGNFFVFKNNYKAY